MSTPRAKAKKKSAKPGRAPARAARPGALVAFCRGLPHATEDIKWGDNLIFSIGGKMFAGFDADGGKPYAFKCSDDDFESLTATPGIIPAPYAARYSWVKVERREALRPAEARSLLRAAYELVRAALPARTRAALARPEPG